jgi:organic hydroperoxide reductase OsmC/OhrA
VPAQPKRLDYSIEVEHTGRLLAGGSPLDVGDEWTAEHLVLAGLARCSLTSLRYHARRIDVAVEASARARGTITKREDDGRYAFVEIHVEIDAQLSPPLDDAALRELLMKAERDCFISASLRVAPAYRWRVGGRDLD